jgi:aryl-alcohol dehydrogenase-like predicted oxidoreductase
MKYRPLGQTGLLVSEIGLGTRAWGGNLSFANDGVVEDRWLKVAFSRALSAGCNLIDTADHFGHGHAESLIGSITNCRKDIIVVTKGGQNFYSRIAPPADPLSLGFSGTALYDVDFSEDYLRLAVERSRERLRKGIISVYLLDNPELRDVQAGLIFDTLDRLKSEGHFRFGGIAIDEPEIGLAALEQRQSPLDVIELTYNLLDSKAAHYDLFALAAAREIGVIVREPLANGLLTGKFESRESLMEEDIRTDFSPDGFRQRAQYARQFDYLVKPERTLTQAAIQFVLNQPAVSSVVVGCKTPEQAKENFQTAFSPPLTEEELASMHNVVRA